MKTAHPPNSHPICCCPSMSLKGTTFVVRHAMLLTGEKLLPAVMQMTAFIKGALLVIHCVPYHSFPKPQRFRGRRWGASPPASATVKGILIGRGRVRCEWPAKPLPPPVSLRLCAWRESLSSFSDLLSSAWLVVWDPQTHREKHTENLKDLWKHQALFSSSSFWTK